MEQRGISNFLKLSQKERVLAKLKKFERASNFFESRLNKTPRLSTDILQKKLKEKAISLAKRDRDESFSAVISVFVDVLSAFTFVTIAVTGKQQLGRCFKVKRFDLPENKDFIFLFIATVPVIADTIKKY